MAEKPDWLHDHNSSEWTEEDFTKSSSRAKGYIINLLFVISITCIYFLGAKSMLQCSWGGQTTTYRKRLSFSFHYCGAQGKNSGLQAWSSAFNRRSGAISVPLFSPLQSLLSLPSKSYFEWIPLFAFSLRRIFF